MKTQAPKLNNGWDRHLIMTRMQKMRRTFDDEFGSGCPAAALVDSTACVFVRVLAEDFGDDERVCVTFLEHRVFVAFV